MVNSEDAAESTPHSPLTPRSDRTASVQDRKVQLRRWWNDRTGSWWWTAAAILLPVVVITPLAVGIMVSTVEAPTPGDFISLLRTALAVGAGAVGLAALLVTGRRQWSTERANRATEHDAAERRITELYIKASDQLGSDKAAVRLAGLYALERLGQTTPDQQEAIGNLLCAYLRMPHPRPHPLPDEPTMEQREAHELAEARYMQERETRQTVLSILTRHNSRTQNPEQHWSPLRIRLQRTDLTDADLTDANLGSASLYGADVTGANLNHANLTGANLTGANLTDTNLTGANLTRADLTDANLTDADLTRAELTGAKLYGADLTKANLYDANLTRAYLAYTNLTDAVLARADLTHAALTDADLTRTDLTRANLTEANLARANLSEATLYGANLTDALLTNADLTNANLTNANHTGSTIDGGVVVNEGTRGKWW